MSALKKNIPLLSILTLVFLCVPTFAFAADGPGAIEEILWHLVNAVFGFFMGLAGLLLNYSIENFVVGFGDKFSGGGTGFIVDALWVNVRDIFNITFIFGLVYIGFKMILNSDDSGTRRWLVSLILAALLVNFSLFITKFVVDFTNILATQIVNGGFGGPKISDFFMNSLGLQSLWAGLPENGSYGYIFGAAMVFIVATFVFAAGGIMLIIRYAALALYMVMSPLMFLGWVFPGLQSVTSSYWKGFLGRAFFAPVYLLLLFFAASIVKQFYANGNQVDFTNLFAGSPTGNPVSASFGDTLAPFILTCIFLIAAVVVANKLSADGAGAALKVGNAMRGKAQQYAGSMTAGGVAYGGRRLVGGAGNLIAENKRVQQLARRGGLAGFAGRSIADTAHKARTSSFDVRSVGGVGKALGVGEGKKGGFAADVKDKEKKEKERAGRYSTQEDTRLYDDMGEEVKEIKEGYEKVISNLDQTMADLANETDPTKRRDLLEKTRKLQGDKEYYEKNPDGDPHFNTFNWVRKNEKPLKQNTYAANLERRNGDFGILSKILENQQENSSAADSIRQEMSKDNTKKLLDVISSLNINPE